MTCDKAEQLIGPYHDGELTDIERILEFEDHLETCPDCAQRLQSLRAVSAAVREKAPYFEASTDLRRRINLETQPSPTPRRTVWPGLLFAFASTGALILAAFFVFRGGGGDDRLQASLIEDHVRSLQADHLFDVASSDRHTVKPWFQGKLDFSPTVPDLKSQGFPLIGGRLEYIDHQPAAALVYGRAKHRINVFVLHTSTASLTPRLFERDGFRLAQWTIGNESYWAVSDITAADLQKFAHEFTRP